MSISFPSPAFFEALKDAMAQNPGCIDGLEPCEAYCGFAIDQQLTVLEFDGRLCDAVVAGGNELDLEFVVAGPLSAWQPLVEAAIDGKSDPSASLSALVERGELEVRTSDDEGPELATAAMPFLQTFLEQARGLDVKIG